MMRVKFSGTMRRWVFDWHGVSVEEARRDGFRGLPADIAARRADILAREG
jgi:hypothetical protein